ncbi:MAG TPA: hypothetical protein PKL77_11490, partial [Candidatus Omnitrophota bacterium]|nr:hypothetical protein [Candidatus Omnitrophota bacterium]
KAIMAVPWLRQTLEKNGVNVPTATTDTWGQPVSNGSVWKRMFDNLVNPATVTVENTDKVTTEIKRLYEATGNTDAMPPSISLTPTKTSLEELYNRDLTNAQVAEIKQEFGLENVDMSSAEAAGIQADVLKSFYGVISAYMDSQQYKADNDETRVSTIKSFYSKLIEAYRKEYMLSKMNPVSRP